jgi:TonB family protein
MREYFLIISVLFLTGATVAQTAQTPQSSNTAQADPVYALSKEGFRLQFDAVVQCYRMGDSTAGRHLIDKIRLTNAEEWFADHLSPEQSTKLTERYNRLFANYAESLENTIKAVVEHDKTDLIPDLENGKGENPTPGRPGAKMSGVISIKHPGLFYGHLKITIEKKDSASWADTYTHQDGAFRFLGFGAWPFWVWEDGTEGEKDSRGSFREPFTVIKQVQPDYPKDARLHRIEGVVLVDVLIDKEGRVKKAEVVQGDPLFAQSALDAVRQWRFKPHKKNGELIEFETTVALHFTLH